MTNFANKNFTIELRTGASASNLHDRSRQQIGGVATQSHNNEGQAVEPALSTRTIIDVNLPFHGDFKSVTLASNNADSSGARLWMVHGAANIAREVITALPCRWLDRYPLKMEISADLQLGQDDDKQHLTFYIDHDQGQRLTFWVNIDAEVFF